MESEIHMWLTLCAWANYDSSFIPLSLLISDPNVLEDLKIVWYPKAMNPCLKISEIFP